MLSQQLQNSPINFNDFKSLQRDRLDIIKQYEPTINSLKQQSKRLIEQGALTKNGIAIDVFDQIVDCYNQEKEDFYSYVQRLHGLPGRKFVEQLDVISRANDITIADDQQIYAELEGIIFNFLCRYYTIEQACDLISMALPIEEQSSKKSHRSAPY